MAEVPSSNPGAFFLILAHMGTREIIRIFMFDGLLLKAEHTFKNILRLFFVI